MIRFYYFSVIDNFISYIIMCYWLGIYKVLFSGHKSRVVCFMQIKCFLKFHCSYYYVTTNKSKKKFTTIACCFAAIKNIVAPQYSYKFFVKQ